MPRFTAWQPSPADGNRFAEGKVAERYSEHFFQMLFQEKYQNLHSESFQQIQRLEFDLTATVAERDEARQYIRELEQMNDDLERAKR